MKRRCACQLLAYPGEFSKNRVSKQQKTRTESQHRGPRKASGTPPGGPPRRPGDGSRQSPITVDQRRCTSAVTLGAAVFARSGASGSPGRQGAAATGTRREHSRRTATGRAAPSIIMPSGSHPASPSKRRSRSPAPRFEPEPEPEVVEEAPVELAEAAAPAPAEAIVNDVVQESIDEASRREALYKKDAPALVAASLLQDMWASLHLHEAPARPTFGAPSQEPPPQLIDNRTNKQIGIRPKVQIIKAAGSGAQAVRSRRRPSSAPARRRPRSARPSSARPGSAKEPEKRPPVPESRKELFRRASKNEDNMKVAAFARWLDLQNRMSLKEVQAVLGSLKYSRTAPVDVVVFDHVLDHLQAKNKKWADERLVMIDMKPPPQPKKKVEAPAPAPPVEVRTYYEPPAQPRFSIVWANVGAEGGAARSRGGGGGPLAAGDVLRVHGRAAAVRAGRRAKAAAEEEEEAAQVEEARGLLLAEGRRRRCEITAFTTAREGPAAVAGRRHVVCAGARRPRGRGGRWLERRRGLRRAVGPHVARHVLDPEGGRRAGRAAGVARQIGTHAGRVASKKQTDAGHAAPRRIAAEIRRRVGRASIFSAGAAGHYESMRPSWRAVVTGSLARPVTRLVWNTAKLDVIPPSSPARDASRPYSASDFRWTARRPPRCPARCATAPRRRRLVAAAARRARRCPVGAAP